MAASGAGSSSAEGGLAVTRRKPLAGSGAEFFSVEGALLSWSRYDGDVATEYSKPVGSSVLRSIRLSEVTSGDHEGLGFRDVSADALLRIIAHAGPDSLEHSVVLSHELRSNRSCARGGKPGG